MKKAWLIVALLVLSTLIVACQPQTVEVTRVVAETQTEMVEVPVEVEVEVPVEVTRVVTETVVEEMEEMMLGSEDRPIKVLFVPSVDAEAIVTGGEVLANALEAATDMSFEVSVPTSYAATIEEMCASPDDTIGFIPAQGYVLANNRCGVTATNRPPRTGSSTSTKYPATSPNRCDPPRENNDTLPPSPILTVTRFGRT